jgi:hypothetical protein
MKPQPIDDSLIDFDTLVKLAKDAPREFEAYKRERIESMISSRADEMQNRLRAQQTHIDRVVSRCSNPYHVNVVLYKELQTQMDKLIAGVADYADPAYSEPSIPNNIVPFPSRKH